MAQTKRAQPTPEALAENIAAESTFHALLGNPRFLRIVLHLWNHAEGEDEVQDIAKAAGLGHANASAILRRAARDGILDRRKESIFVFYAIGESWRDAVAEVAARVGAA